MAGAAAEELSIKSPPSKRGAPWFALISLSLLILRRLEEEDCIIQIESLAPDKRSLLNAKSFVVGR